jgi:hypothetical protein
MLARQIDNSLNPGILLSAFDTDSLDLPGIGFERLRNSMNSVQ